MTIELPFAALCEMVARQCPGARLTAAEPMAGGVSAQVLRLDLERPDGSRLHRVLRVHGPTHAGHGAELEFALLKAVIAAGLPAAAPLAVDVTRTLLPAPYLLLDYVNGTTALEPECAGVRRPLMAATLAAIHATPLVGVPRLPERLDPMPELLDFLPTGSAYATLAARVGALQSTRFEGAPVLLHGDFWPGNILWQGDRIAAVLDWEDAAFGDPLSDVACAALELRYVLGAVEAARFVADYAMHRPVDAVRLALWQLYVAAAAQHVMGNWRLDPVREAHMRREALASIAEAAHAIGSADG